jgi:hypothetical protein
LRRKEVIGKKMLAAPSDFCYESGTSHIMRTFAKSLFFVLLAAWAGGAICAAQDSPPANTPTAKPPAITTKMSGRRFSGVILTVDSKAKTFTLQAADKVGIGVTDKTRIVMAKKPAKFEILAAGQVVTGLERQDASGKWLADTLNVGDQRQVLAEPPPKVVIAPEKKK